jgi:hypothetical protein
MCLRDLVTLQTPWVVSCLTARAIHILYFCAAAMVLLCSKWLAKLWFQLWLFCNHTEWLTHASYHRAALSYVWENLLLLHAEHPGCFLFTSHPSNVSSVCGWVLHRVPIDFQSQSVFWAVTVVLLLRELAGPCKVAWSYFVISLRTCYSANTLGGFFSTARATYHLFVGCSIPNNWLAYL